MELNGFLIKLVISMALVEKISKEISMNLNQNKNKKINVYMLSEAK